VRSSAYQDRHQTATHMMSLQRLEHSFRTYRRVRNLSAHNMHIGNPSDLSSHCLKTLSNGQQVIFPFDGLHSYCVMVKRVHGGSSGSWLGLRCFVFDMMVLVWNERRGRSNSMLICGGFDHVDDSLCLRTNPLRNRIYFFLLHIQRTGPQRLLRRDINITQGTPMADASTQSASESDLSLRTAHRSSHLYGVPICDDY
jgi:hypothetical protein